MTDRLTLTEAAELIGRHRNTLRGWIRTGRLTTASKASGAWTIERAELEALASVHIKEPIAPAGMKLVPQDAWTAMIEQLGNLHLAGQQLAEAREQAGIAKTENRFHLERLAELRQELDQVRADRDRLADAIAGRAPAPEPMAPPRPAGDLVSRFSRVIRRIRR